MIKEHNLFNQFRNNIFCRRELNQYKARKFWIDISAIMSNDDKIMFQIEWNHYLIGEIDHVTFSDFFDSYVNKYYS